MPVYEIINPCDQMTLRADSLLMAGVAVAVLSNGKFGVKGTPILFGWDQWFTDNGISDLSVFIQEHAKELSAVLRSVALGLVDDRDEFDSQITAILCPTERALFIDRHNDRLRTSLSNWVYEARYLADKMDMIYVPRGTENDTVVAG